MRLDDGAVNAPLLLFFSFRTEVIQNDHFTSIRVAGKDGEILMHMLHGMVLNEGVHCPILGEVTVVD